MSRTIDSDIPNPEYLIKSIAEQGYSLETALADLIDNSITANASAVEILIDTAAEPFTLFLADNGDGMTEEDLHRNMKFPSSSPEGIREVNDLGRFGLGMKTASFSQTRKFTVLSRAGSPGVNRATTSGVNRETTHGVDRATTPGVNRPYTARTWDVDHLQQYQEWTIIKNTPCEIDTLLTQYHQLSSGFLNAFPDYQPNTIVVWQGLYKFGDWLGDNKQTALQKEITELTSEYLSLVFHRYMERNLKIRINNNILTPFNPFPTDEPGFRRLETNHRLFRESPLRMEGYILPSRSLDESKDAVSPWTQNGKSLMDMEGLYVYRADRIILYGGWNGIIKKAPRLQLARLKVEIGNNVDQYFHLNVAKSSIVVPYELKLAFLRYVSELKTQAEKEFHNKGLKKIAGTKTRSQNTLFTRQPSSKGILMRVNEDFELIKQLRQQLTQDQYGLVRTILRMVNTSINKVRQVHEDRSFAEAVKEGLTEEEIAKTIVILRDSGLNNQQIEEILTNMGLKTSTIPQHILGPIN